MKNQVIPTCAGNIIPATLLASAFLGFIAVLGFVMVPQDSALNTSMRLEPLSKVLTIGETFTVDVVVESSVPVNAFAGELFFDTKSLAIQAIDYNTSIADLWAEKPWYSNGEGTINFIGGTTRTGGFIGTDKLITVTFKATSQGSGSLFIRDAQIVQHDGLGTDAPLSKPIDALFTITPEQATGTPSNLLVQDSIGSTYRVVEEKPSTDLNGDGKQTIADISIILINIGSTQLRYDLNQDGKVDLKDMAIIMSVN
jgi:hypothetical protein